MTDKDFIVAMLSDGQPHTLTEILRRSFEVRGHGLTVHSRVSDLRKEGYSIAWWQQPGEKRGNASVYQLVGSPSSLSEAAPDAAAASPVAASLSESSLTEPEQELSGPMGGVVSRSTIGSGSVSEAPPLSQGEIPSSLAPCAGSSTGERDVANVEAAGSIPAPRFTGGGPHAGQATHLVGEASARENGTTDARGGEVPPSPVHPRQLTVWEAA